MPTCRTSQGHIQDIPIETQEIPILLHSLTIDFKKVMQEKPLNNWDEFEAELKKLFAHRKYLLEEGRKGVSDFLFRGQANSSWHLKATLERYTGEEECNLLDYYQTMRKIKPQIETFTDRHWELPSREQYDEWLDKEDSLLSRWPGYDFMIYLRHHGFPSPLLDWTRSPYIASYFAFQSAKEKNGYVSIYALLENTGKGMSYCWDSPNIWSLGPDIHSHPRHFIQQSDYTICAILRNQQYYYVPHENVGINSRREQNLLWKFNVPVTCRLKILKHLDTMNVNGFSLFSTEESLVETAALREFYLNKQGDV